MLVTRVINAFTDIGMGMIVAKTKSRFGRARPWLLRMTPVLVIMTILTFSVPEALGYNGKIIYMYTTYILMLAFATTAVGMASAVILPSMTSHFRSREKNAVISSVFAMLAGVAGSVGIQRSTAAMGDTPEAWQRVAIVFALIVLVGQTIMFLFTKERVVIDQSNKSGVSYKQMFKSIARNKYAIIMFFVAALTAIDSAMAGASIYYYKYVFNDMSLIAIVSIVTLPCSVIAISLVPLMTKKVRRRNLVMLGLIFKVISLVMIYIFPTNVTLFVLMQALRSIAYAPLMALMGVFLLNTIEYGEYKTGIRADSMLVSSSSFVNKIATGLGGAMIGWLLAFGGFLSHSEVQPESVGPTIIFIFCAIPAIAGTIQIILLAFYDLDKKYAGITELLKKRNEA